MRLILMYDLDMTTPELTKQYTKFHNWIVARGFIMMQYSVYMKVLNTVTKYPYEKKAIQEKLPKNGNIRLLLITDNQYHKMPILRGTKRINETINTNERRIKIVEVRD